MEVEILKPAEQFKLDAERILDEARILQQNGEIEEALKKLRTCVKKAPEEVKGEDYDESNPAMRILLALGTIAFQAGGWDLLVSQIRFIMRRYNYLQFAMRKMVEKAIEFEEALPSEGRVDRIKSLCDLTEDKVYVEVLRARLTRKLSDIYKEQGNYTEAARVMQNIQIETFGSMPRVEKADFILEQIRLSLQIADYTNAAILSKKISPKYFEGEPKSEEQRDARLRQKVDYYELVIQCLLHESNYLEVSKQYQRIYNTKEIQDDDTKWPDVLRNIALYAILAPYSNEQSDFVYHIKADPKLDDLKLMPPGNAFSLLDVLNAFTTPELISWDFVLQYYAPSLQSTAIFSSSTPEGQAKWNEFRSRVREH
ncbi:proteasome regulatory particle subunit, partial [Spiromyces aspiralis]